MRRLTGVRYVARPPFAPAITLVNRTGFVGLRLRDTVFASMTDCDCKLNIALLSAIFWKLAAGQCARG